MRHALREQHSCSKIPNKRNRTRRMGPFCLVDVTIIVDARISASAASMIAEAGLNENYSSFFCLVKTSRHIKAKSWKAVVETVLTASTRSFATPPRQPQSVHDLVIHDFRPSVTDATILGWT